MPLMDGEGDAPLVDGDGDLALMDGEAALADGDVPGICMSIGDPPMPMLWWTLTHQSHTSVCTGPAT
jgi:hypothetical protein